MKSRFLKWYIRIFLITGIFSSLMFLFPSNDKLFALLIAVQVPTLTFWDRGFTSIATDSTWFTPLALASAYFFTPFVWTCVFLGLTKLVEVIRGKIRNYGR